MELGIIGLGKMGFNMAERLRLAGHKVVGFDFNKDATAKLTAHHAPKTSTTSLITPPIPQAQTAKQKPTGHENLAVGNLETKRVLSF